jgi:hypothetical protein
VALAGSLLLAMISAAATAAPTAPLHCTHPYASYAARQLPVLYVPIETDTIEAAK